MYGMSLLLKSNDSTVDYAPKGSKFLISELENAVGGPFYFVTSSNDEKIFVVNQKNKTELLGYNINANYLYRRLVAGEKVLKGDILICDRKLIDDADLANHLFSETTITADSKSNFETNTYQNEDSNFIGNFS